MSNYNGVRCPACDKRFTDSDDVVVCPQCGAPHHRHCYQEHGACMFAAEHITGKEWKNPDRVEESSESSQQQSATKICGHCGTANPGESIFCQVCGMRMAGPGAQQGYRPGGQQSSQQGTPAAQPFRTYTVNIDPQTLIYGGVSPEESIGGEQAKDLAVFVGPNSAYYLPRFLRFSKAAAMSFSINLSALFLNFAYYFYRKMYLVGGIMLGLFAASLIPYCLYLREMLPDLMKQAEFVSLLTRTGVQIVLPTQEVNYAAAQLYSNIFRVMWTLYLSMSVFLSTMANSIYYKKAVGAVKNIREAVARTMDPARYNVTLAYRGGVSAGAVIMALGIAFIIYCACSTIAFAGIIA